MMKSEGFSGQPGSMKLGAVIGNKVTPQLVQLIVFNLKLDESLHYKLGRLNKTYIVKNLASFNDQNKKVESSAEIYRDQSLV